MATFKETLSPVGRNETELKIRLESDCDRCILEFTAPVSLTLKIQM